MIVKHSDSINVAGTLTSLEVGESCSFRDSEVNLGYLRTKASLTGRELKRIFKVSADRRTLGNNIVVTRLK